MNTSSSANVSDNAALWQRLSAFDFQVNDPDLTFTARLARENAWSQAYTERVLEEYRRFLYLACVTDHPVTPSDAMDQAWHLHLVYSRSYWEDLCPHILQCNLHHEPTQGGSDEADKFKTWYENTLESYQQHFGAAPPADIWPASEERFNPLNLHQRVNVNKHRSLPIKPYLIARFIVMAVLALLLIFFLINTAKPPLVVIFAAVASVYCYYWLNKYSCPRCRKELALDRTGLSNMIGGEIHAELQCKHCHYRKWTKDNETAEKNRNGGGAGCGGCGG